jgi:hypothetical protein
VSRPGGVTATPGRGPLFWASAAAGWAVIGWGVRGALHHHVDTRPAQLVRFLLGGALVHDLVLAPVVLLAGVGLSRTVRGRWRAPVQAALLVAGTLILFTYPELRGFGHALHNPTSLPHNYTANLLLVLGAVAVGTVTVALLTARRRSPEHRRS